MFSIFPLPAKENDQQSSLALGAEFLFSHACERVPFFPVWHNSTTLGTRSLFYSELWLAGLLACDLIGQSDFFVLLLSTVVTHLKTTLWEKYSYI